MDYERIDQYLTSHQEALLEDLRALVGVDSERMTPTDGKPFGDGPAICLHMAEERMRSYGFQVHNYDNYAVTADLAGEEGERGLDILAHLDVVPAGTGWTVTDPFTMKIVDGKAYGRGTADDKGPALCALYAMRAIRELGIPLKKGVRLILGSDEECGSSDLRYYYTKESPAPYSISPDADYPVIHIEKGGLKSGFHSAAPLSGDLPRVISLRGGIQLNVVPSEAHAVLEGMSAGEVQRIATALEPVCGAKFQLEEQEQRLRVTASGTTAHASAPQSGVNAITALLALLAKLPLADAPIHHQIQALAHLFPHGDFYGEALGVNLADELSGKTTLSLDRIAFSSEEELSGMFDCRACLSANDSNTTAVIQEKLSTAGLTPLENTMFAPHYVPEDSPLVVTLMDIYNGMTGEKSRPLCIGGGTYVHALENGVAFGCGMEGIDNHLHGSDEFMGLDQILFSSRIYVRAILALCGTDAQ